MSPTAEQRIREYLDKRGRPSRVTCRKLIGTWRIDDPSSADRRMVAQALAGVGVIADPPVEAADLDEELTVRIADPGELERREHEAQERVGEAEAAREAQRRAEEAEARAEEEARAAAEARAERERAEARAEEEARAAREAAARAAAEERERTAAREAKEREKATARETKERERTAARETKEREKVARREGRRDRPWSGKLWTEQPPRRGKLAPEDADWGDEPVETPAEPPVTIPRGLPRTLLMVGAAAIAFSLFLPWYTGRRGGIEIDELSTGWQWLGVLDVLLAAIAIGAAALVLLRLQDVTAHRILGLVAVIGLAGVAYRIGAPPDEVLGEFILDVDRRIGPFVALLAVATVILGAGLAGDGALADDDAEQRAGDEAHGPAATPSTDRT